VYADKVKDIMSKCLNIPKSNSGYREWSTYYEYLEKTPIKWEIIKEIYII